MVTTIDIDDKLVLEAKRVAADRGVTLDALIENALRRELARSSQDRSYRLNFPTVRGGKPKIDIADRRAIYDDLDPV